MNLFQRLELDEGFVPTVYQCSQGFWTVGFGFNVDPRGGGLTREECLYILSRRILDCENDLRAVFGSTFWDSLDAVRRNSLLNMRYNLGAGGFRGFKNMIAAIKARDFELAADEAHDSRWRVQVGGRGDRIVEEIRSGIDLE